MVDPYEVVGPYWIVVVAGMFVVQDTVALFVEMLETEILVVTGVLDDEDATQGDPVGVMV